MFWGFLIPLSLPARLSKPRTDVPLLLPTSLSEGSDARVLLEDQSETVPQLDLSGIEMGSSHKALCWLCHWQR